MPDTNITTIDPTMASTTPVGQRKIDVRRGALDGTVSSQWFSRPDDQRFLDLDSLIEAIKGRADRSKVSVEETRNLRVIGNREDERLLNLRSPDGTIVSPNHWSFGQICSRVGAPAGFLRELALAPAVLQERLIRGPAEAVKLMRTIDQEGNEVAELRACTGPDYGRVWDWEVANAVKKVAGDGPWKVPGMIDWRTGVYDPFREVTKESTTLYASDRDLFIFMVDDTHPIEVGKLANGDPDYLFPGFMVSNSEVGSAAFSITTLYLRGVCMNRNLWGVEGKKSLRLRHSKGLPIRFMADALPMLRDFANASPALAAQKVANAKNAIVANNDDDMKSWINNLGFSQKQAISIMDAVYQEEGHRARSVWDVCNGVTAVARTINHQDDRTTLERKAGALMDRVSI